MFVKTPGISPVKTRLACHVGVARAEKFFLESVTATCEALHSYRLRHPKFSIYWAVAEEEQSAHRFWQEHHFRFPTIWQGEGSLGERMAHVVSELGHRGEVVLICGTDTPQLSETHVSIAVHHLCSAVSPQVVIGPALDGGFYLLGIHNADIATALRGVTYSTSSVLNDLVRALPTSTMITCINLLRDVDTIEDYSACYDL
jgi:hypothetical protein